MILRLGLAAALMAVWSCSGDEAKAPTEPVSTVQETTKIPDQPGADSGEGAAVKADKPLPKAESTGGSAKSDGAGSKAKDKDKDKEAKDKGAKDKASPAAPVEMLVKTANLRVRIGPGAEHKVVRSLKKGERVKPLACEKKWCKLSDTEYVAESGLKPVK